MLLPDERLRVFVPAFSPDANLVFEVLHRVECTLLEPRVRELTEPTLDEIEPRRTGRREVQMPASALGMREPLGDGLSLVR